MSAVLVIGSILIGGLVALFLVYVALPKSIRAEWDRIRETFAANRAQRKTDRNTAGFQYAVNELNKDPSSRKRLEQHIQCARDFGDYDDFDRGITEALRRVTPNGLGPPVRPGE